MFLHRGEETWHVAPRVYLRGIGVSGVRVRSGAGYTRARFHGCIGPRVTESASAPPAIRFRKMELLSERDRDPDDAGFGCA